MLFDAVLGDRISETIGNTRVVALINGISKRYFQRILLIVLKRLPKLPAGLVCLESCR